MKRRTIMLIIIIVVFASLSIFAIGYSMWSFVDITTLGQESYRISAIEDVTVTNTEKLNIKVFDFENDEVSYSIKSTEKTSLKVVFSVVDETIVSTFIDSIKLDGVDCVYSIVEGKIELTLSSITLNTTHTLTFNFNNKMIYNETFNPSGILDSSSETMLSVYDGE